jgi:hypothetical protein
MTPETLVMKAVAELTSALKGMVLHDAETADALAKVSDLFHKIAASKLVMAKAKEQQNQHHRTHPNARQVVPLPRVVNKPPVQPTIPLPKVQAAPAVDDYHVGGGFSEMQNIRMTTPTAILLMQIVNTPTQIAGSRLQIVENVTLRQGKHVPPSTRPNYILQDDDDEQQHGYNTRS